MRSLTTDQGGMKMSRTSTGARLFPPLGAALAIVATAVALSSSASGALRPAVSAVSYRVAADLAAAHETHAVTAPSTAKGHFEGLLVRSGGEVGVLPRPGAVPTGCKIIPPGSGMPPRVSCQNGSLVLPLPPRSRQWRLAYRLTFADLSGQASAGHVHTGAPGQAGPVAFPLCGPCSPVTKGVLTLAPDQAAAILAGNTYVNVHTAKNLDGEIRGQIKRVPFGVPLGH